MELSPHFRYWTGWLILFFVKELPAATNQTEADTLSEFIWHIKNLRPWTKAVLGPAFFAFCVDLGLHFWLQLSLLPWQWF